MTSFGEINWHQLGSGNCLLYEDNKPVPKTMLIYHQTCLIALPESNFIDLICNICSEIILLKLLLHFNWLNEISIQLFPKSIFLQHALLWIASMRQYDNQGKLWLAFCMNGLFLKYTFVSMRNWEIVYDWMFWMFRNICAQWFWPGEWTWVTKQPVRASLQFCLQM